MKKLIAVLLAGCFGVSLHAAAVGSSESAAKALSVSTTQYDVTVTLVAEDEGGDWGGDDWGGDDWGGDDWGTSGVFYFSATLKKNTAYTIWMDGYDSETISLDAYPYGEMSGEAPSAGFSGVEEQVGTDGKTHYISGMQAEDWEEGDPESWKYYFCLSGEVGEKATFHVIQGEKSFLPEGVEGNPKRLSFEDSENTVSATLESGSNYWFKADLTAGRKYLVRTTGGTAAVPFALKVDSAREFASEADPEYASDTANGAIIVYPRATGKYLFVVSGQQGAAFGLAYRSVPVRAIANHPFAVLSAGSPQVFRPGRNVADAAYYDNIIDEQLFRFTAEKADRWIFDAKGADRAVEMRLYDAKGNVLKTNSTVGDGTFDVRIGYDVPAAGDYYVGVCDPSLTQAGTVACAETRLTARRADVEEDVAEKLSPAAGDVTAKPVEDGSCAGPYALDESRWTRTFTIAARKGLTYQLAMGFADTNVVSTLPLTATVFRRTSSGETVLSTGVELAPGGGLKFEPTANATYGVRVSVLNGEGVDYPAFNLYSVASGEAGERLGVLKVTMKGAESATWSLKGESTDYASGDSIVLTSNELYTVKFSNVTGLSTPAAETVTVPAEVLGVYSDIYDHGDDSYGGAASLKITADEKKAARTLWSDDEADWFVFTTKDGVYNNFTLGDLAGDAVLSVYPSAGRGPAAEPVAGADKVTQVSKLVLSAGTYYVCVTHGTEGKADSSYALVTSSANVGTIQFTKTSVSVKKTSGTATLSVKRTAKEGRVRVRYATVAGSARPGERYVAQGGVLEWAAGDGSSRNITVKLIPDLVAVYGGDTAFQVRLEPMTDEEIEADEYPAQVTVDTCTVTIKETAKSGVTSVEDAYAKTAAKAASVTTEDAALRAGTFFGVLAEDGSQLENGLPQLASVTLTTTVKDGKDDSLSAKVALAGKNYTFKTDSKDPETWEDVGDGYKQIVLRNDSDELTITVKDGRTTDDGAWMTAGGTAELVMDVPDATGKGEQTGIRYRGEIFRQNAKVDDYLKAVAKTFYGYYTLALVPEGVTSADGIPAGNGYLTVKVDNKGTATVAGLLADGTKVSAKVVAAAIRADATSANGYAMYLPVYQAKSPYCFGGTVKLPAKAGKTLPNEDFVRVVDSAETLVWNNDDASLTYYNEEGWRISCAPVGGWYDTVMNLEAYYLNYALSVGTADVSEFPTEALGGDYSYVTGAQPNGEATAFENDVLSAAKRTLVKDGKLYDLVNSVNPCNVQVKLARSTGVVTGSFSLWSENSSSQKEIAGIKHNGVLILSRDDYGALDAAAVSAGFCSSKVTVTEGGKSRKWTYSLPFNIVGVEQDAGDPWAEDKGWNDEWGEEPTEFETK